MNRRLVEVGTGRRIGSRLGRGRRLLRPLLESLEERQMLDAGGASQLPPVIVLGRTLATPATATSASPAPSYFLGEVQNSQVTITYTVYNQQGDPERGVLLTDTLEPGVTFVSSSVTLDGTTTTQLPDQSGQSLAWSLAPIQGFDRESVALTVNLPAADAGLTTPLPIDTGAQAYATLDSGAVSAAASAATLQPGNVANPSLLASTVDADTNDPYIQEEAATLDYNAENIFNFLHTQIGFNSYLGSIRGARGTLWSNAGNALDVASLGVALMRASGIPAQYVSGTLSQTDARELILSMFPAGVQTVGYVPAGTQVSAPASDPQLLAETESHYWFQFNTGSGMTDADPLMPGATIGQTFTTSAGAFTSVPANLEATTEVQLVAEIDNTADSLFGLSGFADTTVLDQTFNDDYLVGRALSIGNFVSTNAIGALFTSQTNTYTPYLQIGDAANPDPAQDTIITGQQYQEDLTSFPFGSEILTGLFVNLSLSDPGQALESYQYTIADRIGIAARQSGGPVSVSVAPGSPPLLSPVQVTTIDVLPGEIDPNVPTELGNAAGALQASYSALLASQSQASSGASQDALDSSAATVFQSVLIAATRERLAAFFAASQVYTDLFSQNLDVKDYFDSPRIVIMSAAAESLSTGAIALSSSFDITKDNIRAVPAPGQSTSAGIALNLVRGPLDTYIETLAGSLSPSAPNLQVSTPASAEIIIDTAQAQGIALVTLLPGQQSLVDNLAITANAKVLISQELASGMIVVTPVQSIEIDGVDRSGWYEIDPQTGQSIGVLDDGTHGIVQSVATYLFSVIQAHQAEFFFGIMVGWGVDTFAGFAGTMLETALDEKLSKQVKKAKALVDVGLIFAWAKEEEARLYLTLPGFALGMSLGLAWGLKSLYQDPPLTPALLDPSAPAIPADNQAGASIAEPSSLPNGAVSASLVTPSAQATGTIQASWSTSTSSSAFLASTLSSASAQVKNSSGATVGSGPVGLAATSPAALSISGSASYSVSGTGTLSFHGPAHTSLGASGNWSNDTATVTGTLSITLTTAGLSLGGIPLPLGTYTIITSAATLSGSGPSTSPDFSGSASLSVSSGTVVLGPGTGTVASGGKPLDPTDETTLDSYTGTLTVSASGNGTDSVSLGGNAGNVLRVTASPATLTTDQNTPVTFAANVQTSLSDTYSYTVNAPSGWTVTIGSSGNVTAMPAPGTQSGTYPIQVIAQSQTDSNLVAQTTVEVTITPTEPGINFTVAPDSVFTVPFDGAELPTAFRAEIENVGPTADRFNLAFSNVPGGFSIEDSGTTVAVPAGQTGILGVYLMPNSGQPIPPPGTPLSFTVTATSATDSSITQTQTETFIVPEVDAVTVTSGPTDVNTTPAGPVNDTITITNAGNVAEDNITFTDSLPSGLTLTGLSPVSLGVGMSTTDTITLTPAASVPLNTLLDATITATFGPAAAPQTQTLLVQLNVVVPGAAALATAADAAAQLGNSNLAAQLADLSAALTNLVQNPTSAVYESQALASLSAIEGLLGADPYLAALVPGLTADGKTLAQATTSTAVQAAVTALGDDLETVGTTLSDEASYQFTLAFVAGSSQVVEPQLPATFQVVLQNTGSQTATYNLTLSGLPSGRHRGAQLPSVTLAPGQSTGSGGIPAFDVMLTSTSTTSLAPGSFTLTASVQEAPEISQSITGSLSARTAVVQVIAVTPNPAFTNPGGTVDVQAQLLNAVNQQQQAEVSFTVASSSGTVLFTSTPVSTTLNVLTTLTTVDLGSFDTAGFALGVDTITINVDDSSGNPIPGATGTGSILIGTPVTATLATTPASLPAGTGTVTSTLEVASQTSYGAPLSLVGETSIAASSGVAVAGSFAYVGTSGGIDIVNVANPAAPSVVSTFGSSDFPGYTVVALQVYNNELVALAQASSNTGQLLLIYSLASPTSPTLLGETSLTFQGANDSYLTGFSISNNHVYTSSTWYRYYISGQQIFAQFGETIDIDISNPAAPSVVSVVYNDPPSSSTGYPDGTSNIWQTAAAGDDVLLVGTTTATGSTVSGVQGEVMVVDTTDPANPSVLENLAIPGMAAVTGILVQGTTALLIGTSGYWANGSSGVTGDAVVAMLDLSDPQSPTVISSQTLNVPSIGLSYLQYLGNNLYVTDSVAGANQAPELLVFDASDPQNVVVTQFPVLNNVKSSDFIASGGLLYASDGTSLSIYSAKAVQDTPVIAQVTIPSGGGVSVVPGSFSLAPTSMTTNPDGSQTLVWDLGFTAGSTSQTITWQDSVAGLQPGQSVAVAQDGSVQFTSNGTTNTLPLPDQYVAGEQIIGLTPPTQTVAPGAAASYLVNLSNPSSSAVTYTLSVQGLTASWVNLGSATVNLPAGGTIATCRSCSPPTPSPPPATTALRSRPPAAVVAGPPRCRAIWSSRDSPRRLIPIRMASSRRFRPG